MWQGLVLFFFLIGCATTYKDLKPEQVKLSQSVVVGRLQINYNGKPFNKSCAVCLNSVNGPCQNLEDNGIFFIPIEKGEGQLRRVVCKDTSPQHYNLEGATFETHGEVNYIGDVTLNWTNSGGFKATSMLGVLGAIIDESKNDGEIEMLVASSKKSLAQITEIYRQQMGRPTSEPKVHLVTVGR